MQAGWDQYTDPWGVTYHWRDTIAAFQARWQKPVLFTEVGYAGRMLGAATFDAPTPRPGPTPPPIRDKQVQAHAYAALAAVWQDVPWFAGFYAWQWDPRPGYDATRDATMAVNGKPAVLDALRGAFAGLRP